MPAPACDQCGKPLPRNSTTRRRFCDSRCRGRWSRAGSPSYPDSGSPRTVALRPSHEPSTAAVSGAVLPEAAPQPAEDWSPAAKATYEALASSRQTELYEPSDWATLWAYVELWDDFLQQPRRSPMMLAELNRMAARLGATVVDRMASGIAFEDDEPEPFSIEGFR